MLPDRVSNPGPLTYESGALSIALRGTAFCTLKSTIVIITIIMIIIIIKTLFVSRIQ